MKKLFLVAAMAAMAMSSCSKNEIDSASIITQSDDAIGFSTFVGINSRGLVTDNADASSGTVTTTNSIQDGFGILGYYHTVSGVATVATFDATYSKPDFMWNQLVTSGDNASTWTYSPIKYWPNNTNDRVSFMAYAPYQSVADGTTAGTGVTIPTNNTAGTPTIKLSLLDAANMVDLVADMRYEQQKPSDGTDKISFSFEHLLTRAAFTVQLAGDAATKVEAGSRIFLTQVKLVGTSSTLYDKDGDVRPSTKLYSEGTFTFGTSATDVNASTTANSNLGSWTLTASTADINLDGATPGTNNIVNFEDYAGETHQTRYIPSGTTADLTSGGTAYTIPRSMELETTASAVNMFISDNHYLFLLPPNGVAGLESAGDVKVYLEYDVVTEDANLYDGHSVVTNYAIVDLPAASLAKGKAYSYLFKVGLEIVEVSAAIDDDWATSVGATADVSTDDAMTLD